MNLGLLKLVGLRIKALRGTKPRKNAKHIPIEYIVLDDGESVVCLDEQDYYSYHDCSTSARELNLRVDKEFWNRIMTNEAFGDSTKDYI